MQVFYRLQYIPISIRAKYLARFLMCNTWVSKGYNMGYFYKKVLLTVCCVVLMHVVRAQSGPMNDMVNAVRYGRVADISRFLDNVVPITINNNQSIYSRTQAEMVLKDFFSKNNPSDFIVGNSGAGENSASTFAIGDLITSNGKYSVYILLKQKNNSYILAEIRFNKQ